MNIAIYLQSLCEGKGGAEKVACQVAGLFASDGHSVTIFHKPSEKPPGYPLHEAIKLVGLTLADPPALLEYRGQFDVAIGFAMQPIYVGIATFADLLDAPFVIQECTNPARMIALMLVNRQEGVSTLAEAFWTRQSVLAHAAGIRVTLPSYRETILPEMRPHCLAFPNSFFIDTDNVAEYEKRARQIVCVGGLKTHNKNGLALLEAFVDSGLGEHGWKVVFCGRNNSIEEFAELAAQAPDGSVIDRGVVEDPHEIYGDAQILVIPSFEEGLPNVVVEAFSFAIPAIGFSDCPGVNELIADGERGFLVDRSSPNSLCEALTELASDNPLRSRMSETAARYAKATFDSRQFSDNWRKLVANAAAGNDTEGNSSRPIAYRNNALSRATRTMIRADLFDPATNSQSKSDESEKLLRIAS